MPGGLTTHVLDTARGRPAAGVRIEVWRIGDSGSREQVGAVETNADGRTDVPLLADGDVRAGEYELVFDIGSYFADAGLASAESPFLGRVPVRFAIDDPDAHYHVPLLASPWSYTTYRGS